MTKMDAPTAPLREIFAENSVFNLRGERVPLGSNVSASETALLHAAVREVRPAASVEVGFAQGISTLAILDAVRANGRGHHHVIDPFQPRYQNAGRTMVERAGLAAHYTFYERHAEEVIPGLPPLQFAFIDSSHLFDLTIAEFVLVDRKLEIGGVIGLHDMWMESQQAVIRYLLANRAYEAWLPAGAPTSAAAPESGWKNLVRTALKRMPGSQRWLARDFAKPWRDFQLGNLVFLRKKANDEREWTFHRSF